MWHYRASDVHAGLLSSYTGATGVHVCLYDTHYLPARKAAQCSMRSSDLTEPFLCACVRSKTLFCGLKAQELTCLDVGVWNGLHRCSAYDLWPKLSHNISAQHIVSQHQKTTSASLDAAMLALRQVGYRHES